MNIVQSVRWFVSTASLLCAFAAYGDVWYVDKDNGSGNEDGTSWATAFTTIQPGIDAAADGTVGGEVWIAQGLYDEERANEGRLQLPSDVALYGGFKGGEVSLHERNIAANETIIDGSRSNAGNPAPAVIHSEQTTNLTISGVTVQGGVAVARGGGIHLLSTNSVTIEHCTIRNNTAGYMGGGLYVADTTGAVINATRFMDNVSDNGAGLKVIASELAVSDSYFEGNAGGNGGGIELDSRMKCNTREF